MSQNTLEIRNLCTSFFTEKGELKAVHDVSLSVGAGKITGIVGESGCGKSMLARSVMGLIPHPGRLVSGEILLNGRDIAKLTQREYCAIRGSELSLVCQDPMTSLNPVMTVGKQVKEAIMLHSDVSGAEAERRTIEAFGSVGIPDPDKRLKSYPHQLSGGLRQRVLIAMAMVCKPKLLIADEPTTALDVTVEAQILRLMRKLCEDGTSILLISHNLGVIAQTCDDVYVMYAGSIVEHADPVTLFESPLHPYTRGLMNAVASLNRNEAALDTIGGIVPNLLHLPEGCAFSLRCSLCGKDCAELFPAMRSVGPGHEVRCHQAGGKEDA